MVLQSTKVNNNTACDIVIERIRPFCLSLFVRHEINSGYLSSITVPTLLMLGVEVPLKVRLLPESHPSPIDGL